jgi:hypothetical protein
MYYMRCLKICQYFLAKDKTGSWCCLPPTFFPFSIRPRRDPPDENSQTRPATAIFLLLPALFKLAVREEAPLCSFRAPSCLWDICRQGKIFYLSEANSFLSATVQTNDHVNALIHPDCATIQTQIVIIRLTPLNACI